MLGPFCGGGGVHVNAGYVHPEIVGSGTAPQTLPAPHKRLGYGRG